VGERERLGDLTKHFPSVQLHERKEFAAIINCGKSEDFMSINPFDVC
jgi:hypothetical protein